MVSTVPKPVSRAISASPAALVSRRRRADSTRARSTYTEGVTSRSRRKARAKVRVPIPPRPPGERRNGQILVGVLGDEALKVAEPVTLGDLRAELRAELGLPALPAQEEDEPARDLQRHRAPEI